EQVAKEPIDQPGGTTSGGRPACPECVWRDLRATLGQAGRLPYPAQLPVELAKGNFQFVKRIVARFVHARVLAGRADEQSAEQKRQRRVILPVAEQASEQVRAAQNRALRRRRSADHDVVAAAGADVAAIDHEFLSPQAGLAGLFV